MAEAGVKQRIRQFLIQQGAVVYSLRTPAVAGSPDLVACYRGRFLGLEVKKPDGRTDSGRLTLQRHHRTQIQRAGGFAAQVRSTSDVAGLLRVVDELNRKP